jgi:hypothetical protein
MSCAMHTYDTLEAAQKEIIMLRRKFSANRPGYRIYLCFTCGKYYIKQED